MVIALIEEYIESTLTSVFCQWITKYPSGSFKDFFNYSPATKFMMTLKLICYTCVLLYHLLIKHSWIQILKFCYFVVDQGKREWVSLWPEPPQRRLKMGSHSYLMTPLGEIDNNYLIDSPRQIFQDYFFTKKKIQNLVVVR